jgi:hypothetical protein
MTTATINKKITELKQELQLKFFVSKVGYFGSYADNLPIMECPKCMTIMKRLYSAPGIVFKGNGWGSKP